MSGAVMKMERGRPGKYSNPATWGVGAAGGQPSAPVSSGSGPPGSCPAHRAWTPLFQSSPLALLREATPIPRADHSPFLEQVTPPSQESQCLMTDQYGDRGGLAALAQAGQRRRVIPVPELLVGLACTAARLLPPPSPAFSGIDPKNTLNKIPAR